jgi:hypothetical protein
MVVSGCFRSTFNDLCLWPTLFPFLVDGCLNAHIPDTINLHLWNPNNLCAFDKLFWYFVISFQCSDKLGLSLELGSFAAGVMISTTDLGQHTLEQVTHFP